MTRFRQRLPTPLFSVGLALATLISLTAGTRPSKPLPEDTRKAHRIVVNSLAGVAGAEPGKITLPDAMALGARDPADNLIQFDPALSPAGPLVIHLAQPLAFDGHAGEDSIDGAGVSAGVILDSTRSADAGVVISSHEKGRFANITLRGGRQRVALVKEDGQLTLEKVQVCDGGGPGVAGFGQARVTADGGTFSGNATHGIELHGQAVATLNGVVIKGNGQSGMAGFDQADFTATDCQLLGNGEWNMVLTHHSQAELIACSLRLGRFAGIDMSESSSVRCRDCTIDNGGRFGVFATGSTEVVLTKTRVQHSGGRGVELQDQAKLVLNEATIDTNEDYGVILFGQSNISATRTVFSGNAAHGVSLRGPASGAFVGCGFTRNKYSGVGCLDGADGGRVRVTQCLFSRNGMRPIYRGPLHIDPLVPTPVAVQDKTVECMADANAVIELYLDRIGEAGRYLRTVHADARGRFQVSCADVPDGFVMTASATVNESTSEFNVIAGSASEVVLAALLGRTGPFSDEGGQPNLQSVVRRWKPGTQVTFQLAKAPSAAVERYVRFLVARIPQWTNGTLSADVRIGSTATASSRSVVVPIRYLNADSQQLQGRGGFTFMKWDTAGYFQPPMEILLALGAEPEETCPRVMAHEIGHVLGLCHTRVGLLSRMQGSTAPNSAFLNDFSPMMTFYDVLALQVLSNPQCKGGTTLRELIALSAQSQAGPTTVAEAPPSDDSASTFSPPDTPRTPTPRRTARSTRRR